MAAARDIADKRGETVMRFRRDRIKIDPKLNARDMSTPDNIEHVEALAVSMRDNGWLSDSLLKVMVKGDDDDTVTLTVGHCRVAAFDLAVSRGWVEPDSLLPAFSEPKGTTLFDLYARQISGNGTSKGLNAAEATMNIKRMLSFGKSVDQVAKAIGKSTSWVNALLNFEEQATPEVHQMVAEGKVSMNAAQAAIRENGGGGAAEALKQAFQRATGEGRKTVTTKDVRPKPKRLSDELIETMISVLRETTKGLVPGSATRRRVEEVLERVDEARGE